MAFLKGLFGKKEKTSTTTENTPANTEKKTVVTIFRETILRSQVDTELTDGQRLEIVELLRNIYNTGFSRSSIHTASQNPNPGVRKYIEQFLKEVDQQK